MRLVNLYSNLHRHFIAIFDRILSEMNKIKYPTLKLFVVTFFVIFISLPVNGAQTSVTSSGNDMYVSLGNLCEYIGDIQIDDNGKKNFCSFMPVLSFSYDSFFENSPFAISPQLGASLPQSGRDENIKRMVIYTLLNAKYKTYYVNIIGGVGFYFTRIWGPGGEEILNNGNSSDSFPLPQDPVYSRNVIVNLGLSAELSKDVSAEIYTYVFNALKKEDRSFSAGLALSYHFGEIL